MGESYEYVNKLEGAIAIRMAFDQGETDNKASDITDEVIGKAVRRWPGEMVHCRVVKETLEAIKCVKLKEIEGEELEELRLVEAALIIYR